MKLFATKVSPIATEVVRTLVSSGAIEVPAPREAERDVEAVLQQYLQAEREVTERARTVLDRAGQGNQDYGRVMRLAADEKGIKVGDEMLDYLLDQLVEMFQYSQNIEEIFVEDVELRRQMAPVFRRHISADSTLDAEVRAQMKHVKEGTRDWDIEYARQVEIAKRKKGLS
jgi:hypothetical protein